MRLFIILSLMTLSMTTIAAEVQIRHMPSGTGSVLFAVDGKVLLFYSLTETPIKKIKPFKGGFLALTESELFTAVIHDAPDKKTKSADTGNTNGTVSLRRLASCLNGSIQDFDGDDVPEVFCSHATPLGGFLSAILARDATTGHYKVMNEYFASEAWKRTTITDDTFGLIKTAYYHHSTGNSDKMLKLLSENFSKPRMEEIIQYFKKMGSGEIFTEVSLTGAGLPYTFKVTIIDARINAKTAKGQSWDAMNNPPDPFVELSVDSAVYKTPALDESTNPEWNHVVTLELFPFSQLTVKVFDWDASGPQLIAGKSYRIDKELKGLFSGKPLQHRTSLKSVPKLRMSFVPVK